MSEEAGLVRLVEDDAALMAAQVQGLRLRGFAVEPFAAAEPALAGLGPDWPGVILSDVRMPGMDGLDFARAVRALDPELPVILLTGHGDVEMAVQALKGGAYDFLTKPVGGDLLEATLRRALATRRLVLENRALREAAPSAEQDLPGHSAAILRLREAAERVAEASLDTLITGGSGAGKERLARYLHRLGPRRARPFVHVNCAAIAPERFDAELLGVAGGRGPRSIGRIERAHRGLLFLDEIDALPLDLQARLLNVIETRELWPVGAEAARPVDLWVVASTRADLPALVAQGRFRADLRYRLGGVVLHVPPLAERREDVGPLFRHFAQGAAARIGRPVPPLTPALKAHLESHDWPGNLRELAQFAERHVMEIALEGAAPDDLRPLSELVADYEAALIRDALRQAQGNATLAMERLKLPRKTFYDKLSRHGIVPRDFRAG
ncbi:sigma-54-dependent transcriptional regulator [Paenirhodobacter sp.]|uniref:sigma-54-dependent transcriptional regulator n=1 Tax=Paenirhodobacter sp. TaxID=1965326 RepID=UPI003B506F81